MHENKAFPAIDSEESDDISQKLYEKPQRIINIGLLDPFIAKGQKQRLKSNLIEHFDFEALYPSVWKHLYSWYSADVQIVRSLKKDVLNRHVMILDLYPDREQQQFHGYQYASGCQNLWSGQNSTHEPDQAVNDQLSNTERLSVPKAIIKDSERKNQTPIQSLADEVRNAYLDSNLDGSARG